MPWLDDQPDSFACSCHLAPNMQVIARSDNVHPLVMWPVTPTTSRTYIYQLFPKDWFNQPDFDAKMKVYDDFMTLALGEDRSMVNSLQNVMTSQQFHPGPMSILEKGIHHVLNDYLDRIFGGS